jgi:glycopeptide antibiotics resistance protein
LTGPPVLRPILLLYAVGVAAITVVPYRLRPSPWPRTEPWWAVIQWVPFQVPVWSFALNVLLFVPLGILVPLLWARLATAGRIALVGFGVSAAVELTQLALWVSLGNRRTVDINDLIANTAGAVLGLVLLRLMTYRRSQARM